MSSQEVIEILDEVDVDAFPRVEEGDSEGEEVFRSAENAFDDRVLTALPADTVEPREYDSDGDLGWLKYLRKLPSRWPVA